MLDRLDDHEKRLDFVERDFIEALEAIERLNAVRRQMSGARRARLARHSLPSGRPQAGPVGRSRPGSTPGPASDTGCTPGQLAYSLLASGVAGNPLRSRIRIQKRF